MSLKVTLQEYTCSVIKIVTLQCLCGANLFFHFGNTWPFISAQRGFE